MADSSVVNPTVTLIVAGLGFLGVTVSPIVIAMINRGGKSEDIPAGVAMPRSEYDQLLEHIARLDDEAARYSSELQRVLKELEEERELRIRAEIQLEAFTTAKKGTRRAP